MPRTRHCAKSQTLDTTSVMSIPLPKQTSILDAAIDHQKDSLKTLESNMETMGDQFADRAVEIVERGLKSSYAKAADRIRAIELPFFVLTDGGSYFASSQSAAVLPQSEIETVEVTACLPLETV